MSIIPYLQRQAFGPDVTRAMGVAFDEVCRTLEIDRTGVVQPRIVARKIIELAQMGENDSERLRDGALETFGFGASPSQAARPPAASRTSPRSVY
jgi:hypothetical protein